MCICPPTFGTCGLRDNYFTTVIAGYTTRSINWVNRVFWKKYGKDIEISWAKFRESPGETIRVWWSWNSMTNGTVNGHCKKLKNQVQAFFPREQNRLLP